MHRGEEPSCGTLREGIDGMFVLVKEEKRVGHSEIVTRARAQLQCDGYEGTCTALTGALRGAARSKRELLGCKEQD